MVRTSAINPWSLLRPYPWRPPLAILPIGLDHLVYVTPDLEATVLDLGVRLGVTATTGGQHPSWGTRNALLALGYRSYLEVMGPDPDLSRPPQGRPFSLDGLTTPRLVTWVCRGKDLEAIVGKAAIVGVDLGSVQRRSRRRLDGSLLEWSMTDLYAHREGGIVPYFIDWGESEHPSESSSRGCTLDGLRGEHPDAERVQEILRNLGLGDLRVTAGPRPRLIATIAGRRGQVELA